MAHLWFAREVQCITTGSRATSFSESPAGFVLYAIPEGRFSSILSSPKELVYGTYRIDGSLLPAQGSLVRHRGQALQGRVPQGREEHIPRAPNTRHVGMLCLLHG